MSFTAMLMAWNIYEPRGPREAMLRGGLPNFGPARVLGARAGPKNQNL